MLTGARLFNVNVNCADLERSRRFYVDGLGLTPGIRTTPETEQPGVAFGLDRARWDAWILLGDRGYQGAAVDLLEWQVPEPTGAPPARVNECGWQRIGIGVPAIEAAMRAIPEHGGELWSPVLEHSFGEGNTIRLALASDPDGVLLEVMEGGGPAVSLIGLVCADLEASCAFYSSLGFVELTRFVSKSDDAAHLRIDGPHAMDEVVMSAPGGGDAMLILVGFRTPPGVRAPARPANALGMWRVAFLVPDLDAAAQALADLDVATLSDPVEMAMGPGLPELRFVCFAGPDGEVLELIEEPTS